MTNSNIQTAKKPPIWLYALAVFITQLDGGAVSTLLPAISRNFHLTPVNASWVAGLYTLGLVVGTPIVSNLSDHYGTKKVFLTELVLWFIGSLITFLSPNYFVMLAGRLVQSLGDCGIIVLSMSEMLRAAKKGKQGRKVSLIGVVSGLSAIFGPIIAGISMGKTGNWRTFYEILMPCIVILFLLAWKFLDNLQGQQDEKTDYVGITEFTVTLATGMLALSLAQHLQTYLMAIIILVVVAIVSCVLFVKHEKSLATDTMPFLPIKLLKQPAYVLTILLGALGGMLFAIFIYIPTYVHLTFHLPVRLAGMVLVGTGLGSVIGSYLGGLTSDKKGMRKALLSASIVVGVMSLAIALTIADLKAFIALSFVFGIGLGMLMSAPLQVIAGRLSEPADRIQAIGGLSTTKKIGVTIAPLIFGTVIQLSAVNGVPGLSSFRNMFIVVIVIAVLCIWATLKIPFATIDNKNK